MQHFLQDLVVEICFGWHKRSPFPVARLPIAIPSHLQVWQAEVIWDATPQNRDLRTLDRIFLRIKQFGIWKKPYIPYCVFFMFSGFDHHFNLPMSMKTWILHLCIDLPGPEHQRVVQQDSKKGLLEAGGQSFFLDIWYSVTRGLLIYPYVYNRCIYIYAKHNISCYMSYIHTLYLSYVTHRQISYMYIHVYDVSNVLDRFWYITYHTSYISYHSPCLHYIMKHIQKLEEKPSFSSWFVSFVNTTFCSKNLREKSYRPTARPQDLFGEASIEIQPRVEGWSLPFPLSFEGVCQHLQRGAKWFLKGVNSPSLRV